jgi:hypothetical protein
MSGLQFNDTSTRQGLIQDCEDRLNFPAAGISGNTVLLQQFTRYLNIWYQKVVTMIFAAEDDWDWDDSNNTDYPIATTNLVINQQDYGIPVSLSALKIQRIDILFDGITWTRCNPIDVQSISKAADTTTIANSFSAMSPCYDIKSNALFLYPIPTINVTAGLKVWFLRGPLEFVTSDTTKKPGIDPAFHSMISVGAAYDYASDKNLPTQGPLQAKLQDYEVRLKQYYGRKDEDLNWSLASLLPDYDDQGYGSPSHYTNNN